MSPDSTSADRHLRRRERRPLGPRVLALGTFAAAGMLLVTSGLTADGQQLRSGSVSDLRGLVAEERRQTDRLRTRVAELDADVTRLSRSAGSGATAKRLQQRSSRIRPAAGFTEVAGPGLRIVLDDAPQDVLDRAVDTGTPDPEQLIVHQQDIQAVVNALWKGGAEAVSLMDQRVISTTGIKCVGNTVILHGVPYSPPYRIAAVGDPLALQAALDDSFYVASYRQTADDYGLGYQAESATQIGIPAYEGGVRLRSASPLTPADGPRDPD